MIGARVCGGSGGVCASGGVGGGAHAVGFRVSVPLWLS